MTATQRYTVQSIRVMCQLQRFVLRQCVKMKFFGVYYVKTHGSYQVFLYFVVPLPPSNNSDSYLFCIVHSISSLQGILLEIPYGLIFFHFLHSFSLDLVQTRRLRLWMGGDHCILLLFGINWPVFNFCWNLEPISRLVS